MKSYTQDEGTGQKNKWILSFAANKTQFNINSPTYPTGGYTISGNTWTSPQTGVWYLIGVSRSGGTYTFFKQGESDGTGTCSYSIPSISAPLTIGFAEGTTGFNGAIDEAMIFDRALSSKEVKYIYQTGGKRLSYNYVHQRFNGYDGYIYNDGLGRVIQKRIRAEDSAEVKQGYHDGQAARNTSILQTSGKIDGAFSFNGTADRINIGNINQTAYAVSLWFYNSSIINKSSTTSTVINIGNDSQARISFGDSTASATDEIITVLSGNGKGSAWTSSSASIAVGWHHLVVNWDVQNSKYLIYLDGQQKQNTVYGTPSLLNADSVIIGCTNQSNGYFTGAIDQVIIFNKSLTEWEVQELYNNNSGTSNITQFGDAVIAHWKMDDHKENTVVVDSNCGVYRAVDIEYDELSRGSRQTLPYFSDGPAFTSWNDTIPTSLTEYDSISRVTIVTPPQGDNEDNNGDSKADSPTGPSTSEYSLEALGTERMFVVTSTDADGKQKKSYTNAAGQVVRIEDVITGGNYVTKYEYDRLGRSTKTIDNSNNEFIAEYDSLGRKIKSVDADMGEWKYEYDDSGRMTKQIDAKGNEIRLVYGDTELGRLTEKRIYNSSQQLVDTIYYSYDSSDDPSYTVHKGQLYKVNDRQGWTKSGYDSRGRSTKTTRYLDVTDKNYTTYTAYDDADRAVQLTYPDNDAVIAYDYDSTGNLIKVESLWGTEGQEVFYKSRGYTEEGSLKGADFGNNGIVKTDYEYYENSKRLKKVHTYKDATDLQDLNYTYDKVSNVTNITDTEYTTGAASATMTNIQYDELHRLTSLNSVSKGITLNYSYSPLGNIITNGERGTNTYTYTPSSQPHAVKSVGSKSFGYDVCGNMTTRQSLNNGDQTLTYDEENHLIGVQIAGGSTVNFGYSGGGERLWKKVNGVVTQVWIGNIYEIKDNKVLCHVYAGDKLIATFEPASTLACIIGNNPYLHKGYEVTRAVYAGLFCGGRTPITFLGTSIFVGLYTGIRRRKDQREGNHFFYRNPYRQIGLMMIIAAAFVTSMLEQTFADSPQYSPVFYYYHSDHLGSSQVMTDRNGVLVQHYGYTAFGCEQYRNNGDAFSVTNRYTGQQLDEETGLYYYGSRYYDPEIARFIQADSVVPAEFNSQALNRYSYCVNNPLKYIDPTGQWFWAIIGAISGWLTSAAVIKAMIIGAVIGAGLAALTRGNILKGALCGAIGGMFSVTGNPALIMAGGALGAVIAGGDPMMGAMTAGICFGLSRGVIASCSQSPFAGAFKVFGDKTMQEIAISTSAGAVAGGVTAELFGGNFGEGAAMGAASAAAGCVIATKLDEFVIQACEFPEIKGTWVLGRPDPMDIDLTMHYEEEWREIGKARFELMYEYSDVSLDNECGWGYSGRGGIYTEVTGEWNTGTRIYFYPPDKVTDIRTQYVYLNRPENNKGMAVYGCISQEAKFGHYWDATYDSGWYKISGTERFREYGLQNIHATVFKTGNPTAPFGLEYKSPAIPCFNTP